MKCENKVGVEFDSLSQRLVYSYMVSYSKFIPADIKENSSRYRFALLDGSMDGVAWRFFGAGNMDWYDGAMPGWRVTDCNFSEAVIYDTWMGKSKFYDTGLEDSDFNYVGFDRSTFKGGSFRNCKIENCELAGMTVNGINVEEALKLYKEKNKNNI